MSLHGHRRQSIPPAVEPRRGLRRGSGPLSGSSSEGREQAEGPGSLPRIYRRHVGVSERVRPPDPDDRIHATDWALEAKCRGMENPDAFFPPRGGKYPKAVREMCATCPVWRECLKYAKSSVSSWTFGYWGGLTELERRGKTLEQAIALAESRRVEKAS